MSKTVVILGAGVGGQLAALAVKRKFKDCIVYLVGPDIKEPDGLFYLNRKIEGFTTGRDRIDVEYTSIGNCSPSEYQIKSRGYEADLSESSFNKIGKTEVGYNLRLNDLRKVISDGVSFIRCNATEVNTSQSYVKCDNLTIDHYDYLISTVPLTVFFNLCQVKYDPNLFKFKPVYVSSLKLSDLPTDYIKVVYDLRKSSDSYRINYYYSNEYPDSYTRCDKESIVCPENHGVGSFRKLVPGKIIPSEDIDKLVSSLEVSHPNIKLLGRYARWKYHYTVDQTFYDTIEFLKESHDYGN